MQDDTRVRTTRASATRTSELIARHVTKGDLGQVYRLANWLSKWTSNSDEVIQSMSSQVLMSAIESKQVNLVVEKKNIPLKLAVPQIVCAFIWSMALVRMTRNKETIGHLVRTIWIQMANKLCENNLRLSVPPKGKIKGKDRQVVRMFFLALLQEIQRIEDPSLAIYIYAFVWQLSHLLDSIAVKRNNQFYSKRVAKLIESLDAGSLLASFVQVCQPGQAECLIAKFQPRMEKAIEKKFTENVDAMRQINEIDAQIMAPLLLFILRPWLMLDSAEKQQTLVLDYLECRFSQTNSLPESATKEEIMIRWLVELVTMMIRIGCVSQAVPMIKAIKSATTVQITNLMKQTCPSATGRLVMKWNRCSQWNEYIKRLEACRAISQKLSIQRSTSWVYPVQQDESQYDVLVVHADVMLWLVAQTSEEIQADQVEDLFVKLPRWCALPKVPEPIAPELFARQLKEQWIQRFSRSASAKSFVEANYTLMQTTSLEHILTTALPHWFHLHQDMVVKAWPLVWNLLIDELAPPELADGFRRGLHPVFLGIVNTFVSSISDGQTKKNIQALIDFCSWTALSASFSIMPAWVYLYESLWRTGVPLMKKEIVLQDTPPSFLQEWISHVNTKKLISWALGIRALQTIQSDSFSIPGEIGKHVVGELMKRRKHSVLKRTMRLAQ